MLEWKIGTDMSISVKLWYDVLSSIRDSNRYA